MATQDDYIRTALRVPPDLHARIHEQAKANNRTFNAEIVARLEGSFTEAGAADGDKKLEAVADRAAKTALDAMLELLDERVKGDVARFGPSILLSQPVQAGESKVPQIPGVNAPAKQSKRKP